MRRSFVILLLLAAFGVAASFCIVILDEREQAFRTFLNDPEFKAFGVQLGEPVLTEPGWYVRIPGLQQLYLYDRRNRATTFLFTTRRDLENQPLAKMRSAIIQSRDGLTFIEYG